MGLFYNSTTFGLFSNRTTFLMRDYSSHIETIFSWNYFLQVKQRITTNKKVDHSAVHHPQTGPESADPLAEITDLSNEFSEAASTSVEGVGNTHGAGDASTHGTTAPSATFTPQGGRLSRDQAHHQRRVRLRVPRPTQKKQGSDLRRRSFLCTALSCATR